MKFLYQGYIQLEKLKPLCHPQGSSRLIQNISKINTLTIIMIFDVEMLVKSILAYYASLKLTLIKAAGSPGIFNDLFS